MRTLTDIIYQYENKEFNFGKFDCCIFVASIIEEYTGKELPRWKGVLNYTSYTEAMKTLRKLNCNKLEELPTKILGTNRKPISEVKLGEPVYYVNEEGEGVLGICNGAQAYFLSKSGGLTTRKVEDCSYCWSIDKWAK